MLGAIASFISELFGTFFLFFTRKGLVAAASLAAVMVTVTTLILLFKTLVASVLALAVIPSWLSAWLGVFLPGNFSQVLGYVSSAKICKFAYSLLRDKIALVNNAS